MKKSFALLLVLLIVCLSFTFLTACSSGDELVGTWAETYDSDDGTRVNSHWKFLDNGTIQTSQFGSPFQEDNLYSWEYSKEDKCYYIIFSKGFGEVKHKVVFTKDKKSFTLTPTGEYSDPNHPENATYIKE